MGRRNRLVVAFALAALWMLAGRVECAAQAEKARYVEGTFARIPKKQKGTFDISDEKVLVFGWEKGNWTLPYDQITEWEPSMLRMVGPSGSGPKRKPRLSIRFKDPAQHGKEELCIFEFEVGKMMDLPKVLEFRTGKRAANRSSR